MDISHNHNKQPGHLAAIGDDNNLSSKSSSWVSLIKDDDDEYEGDDDDFPNDALFFSCSFSALSRVNAVEAKAANLKDKQNLRNLKLSWNWEGNDGVEVCDEENLLEGLQPHHALKCLHVEGYMGVRFSSWLPSLTSLVNLKIWKSKVQHLPPLYQLPSLRYLDLRNFKCSPLDYITGVDWQFHITSKA
ncbi:putative disease resistance protein rga1 [Quercus suber]|uniref:Disease resistance protein rga1 n=1 Tax=Quercus suber TaxID=58331 RepID=A0AAW0JKX8_QUESU